MPTTTTLPAPQVYTSLAKGMKKSELEEFEGPGGDEILAELKFLTHEQRLPAVRYVQARQMDAQARGAVGVGWGAGGVDLGYAAVTHEGAV